MKKLVTLLLVLVGYVGTVSAWTTVKLLNSVEGNWGSTATTTMVKIGDGSNNYFYYILDSSTVTDSDGNYYFRIYVSDDAKYYGSWDNDFAILDYNNYGGKESTNSFKLVTDKSSKYIISVGYWDDVWHFTATTYSGTGTVTFVNSRNFSNPKAYVYCTGGANLTGGWPGIAMSANADGTYSLSNVNIGKGSKIIISDNGSDQLPDQTFTGDIVIYEKGVVPNQTVSVNATYGMSTFCSQYPLDFSTASPSDLKAYRIYESSTNGLLYISEVNKVPAGVGVYLEGSGDYTVSPTATATSIGDNMLVGVTSETAISQESGSNTNFILTTNKGASATPKFYKVNTAGNTVAAGKAYLQIPTANVGARQFFWFEEEGETTGVEALKPETMTDGQAYNLAGQRVAQPTKGLYIVNGKKYMVK